MQCACRRQQPRWWGCCWGWHFCTSVQVGAPSGPQSRSCRVIHIRYRGTLQADTSYGPRIIMNAFATHTGQTSCTSGPASLCKFLDPFTLNEPWLYLPLGIRVHCMAGSALAIWAAFLLLTALHIYANVRAVRSLRLTSLNAPRLQLLLTHALRQVRSTPCLISSRMVVRLRVEPGASASILGNLPPENQLHADSAKHTLCTSTATRRRMLMHLI